MRSRSLAVLVPLGLALAGCGGSPAPRASDAGVETARDAVVDGALDAPSGDARDGDARYDDGPCQPGLPRCFGDFGYQICQQDGTWGSSQTCAGYSMNGTTSFCAEIPMATPDGGTWGTCVDPACWYWLGRGALSGATPVGVCEPDGTIDQCDSGGTLSVHACAGTCTQVATLDGRAIGYCAPACEDGARECLGGPFYRACANGRWGAPQTCAASACNPVATGAVPDTRCGGTCDRGTSRCSDDLGAVESCGADGAWTVDRTCLLGRCVPAGAQAECETACTPGAHQCAFDGAPTESLCDAHGAAWGAETPCATGTSCRVSGNVALGCVACVGAGNALGGADSRCDAQGLATCGADNQFAPSVPCAAPQACQSVTRGPSTIAACAAP
ncbi:MAG TPA: hypothetical protein VH560_13740 [Polyangia bacterium]|jgi:hypothetical protein|nr:hypothetical protein [Polyangia bacterium]